jgi:predicted alpha/beta-fold hydrolase
MGASMLTLYLINEGDKSPLSGALTYGIPFNLKDNVEYFRNTAFKFYDRAMGFNIYLIFKSKIDELRKYCDPVKINKFVESLDRSKGSLMDID